MHRDQRELIILLCTQVGMVMEDAVTSALTFSILDDDNYVQALDELEAQSSKIAKLIAAARALVEPER